jgi:hypothetical protein
MLALPVSQIDQGEVGAVPSPVFYQAECFFVKVDALIEVQDIDVVVGKGEFH